MSGVRTRSAINKNKETCVSGCECTNCRDKLIVAILQKLSDDQDNILDVFNKRLHSMGKNLEKLSLAVSELKDSIDNLECKNAELEIKISKYMKNAESTLPVLSEEKDKCLKQEYFDAKLNEGISSLNVNLESVINKNFEPLTLKLCSFIGDLNSSAKGVVACKPALPVPELGISRGTLGSSSIVPTSVVYAEQRLSSVPVACANEFSSSRSSSIGSNFVSPSLSEKYIPGSELGSPIDLSPAAGRRNFGRRQRVFGGSTRTEGPKELLGWIHLSNVPTFVTPSGLCAYVSNKFGLRTVICKSLLGRTQSPQLCSYLSYKVGVRANYANELLNPRRWPLGVRMRKFLEHPP